MSILEDLDLMELLDELPTGTDFDLDDILSEFSTPGLFTPIKVEEKEPSPAAETEEAVEEILPEEPVAAVIAEEVLPEPVTEEISETVEAAPSVIADIEAEEAPATVVSEEEDDDMIIVPEITMDTAVKEEDTVYEHNENTLFGDSLGLCDILFEFSTSAEETGAEEEDDVKVYAPAAQTEDTAVEEDEDDVKVYVPEAPAVSASSNELPSQDTLLFDSADLTEALISEQAEAPAPVQPKAPGLFAKAAAAIKGLFGAKKAAAPIAQPVEEELVTLFVPEADSNEEAVPVIALTEEPVEEPGSAETEAVMSEADLLFLFTDEAVSVDESAEEEPAEDVLNAEDPIEEPLQEELTVEAVEVLAAEITEAELTAEEDVLVYEAEPSAEPEEVEVIEAFSEEPSVESEEAEPAAESEEIAAENAEDQNAPTIVFDAIDLSAEAAPAEVPSAEAVPAVETKKTPGFFTKAAAMVMGLFGSKKAPAAAVQPAEEATAPLFVPEADLDEDAVPVIALSDESAEEPVSDEAEAVMSEADLLFLFADDALEAEETVAEEAAEEIPVAEEAAIEAFVSEAVDIEEPAAEEINTALEESIPVLEDSVEAEAVLPISEETEAVAEPEEVAVEEVTLENEFSIHDILFELSDYAEDEEEIHPAAPSVFDDIIIPEEEDIKVYVPEEIPVAQAAVEQTEPTVVFDAIDLSEEPAPTAVPTAAEPKKAPGFFGKAAGLVAGLFASKKAAKAVAPAASVSAPADKEDPFADMAALFNDTASDDLSGLDDLMLELELQEEREAELAREAAAREAAERLAREEQQRILELEAQRLAQAEADAEAEALRAEAAAALEASVAFEAPVLEEPSLQAASPAYDFTAVDLSAQAEEYTAPQMNIDINEEVPEEVGDLLEMPDVEQTAASEETPEEAAARKKKEDDSLHYTPEESPAKAVSSHIRNRFGAAFAAFTESSEDYDEEEALGPELPAGKAYRFFNKYINGYRFRLRVSTILCVILGWISLGLPVLGSLKNPAAAAAMCLMILLTVMLAGADILAVGVRNLLQKRPSIHSLVAISCFASVIDAIVIIVTKGVGGYLPFCAVSAISMCFAIYGSLLYCRSQRLNFKTLDRATEPMTISVDYGIVEEDTSTVYRTPGHPEGYIHHSEEEDLSETVFSIVAPILIPAIPVMTVIAALFSGGFGDFFHIMAAMFAAAASFGALIAFPLPYFLVQKELYATKAAIAGWAGVRELGRVSNMIVSDRDLFPDETVSIKSVRIVDNVPPQLTLSYMCSVIAHSESCLVPAFTQLAENNDCELLEVENFQCHEAGGLSAEIGPDSVLVASHSYMKLQGFRIPARKKDSENALFLAVNGHVIAYIIVDYKPIKSVRAGLQSALRGNVEMIFAARDFNVTPLLISKKFKSTTETLRFPSYSQRYEITSQVNSETAACAAVVYRKSFYSYAVVVEKARYLYNSVSWGVILSTVSSILGVLFMFIMALTGGAAAITVGRLLVFMLLWLVPTLALTVSITK